MLQFVVHRQGDSVGVAAVDLDGGTQASGGVRDGSDPLVLDVQDAVPLGHKLALDDLAEGQEVIEYGVPIGVATTAIRTGQHVHTHNLKGQRWA
jgi:(2R)-sulfolactate sulfo-lyase subunit alpha